MYDCELCTYCIRCKNEKLRDKLVNLHFKKNHPNTKHNFNRTHDCIKNYLYKGSNYTAIQDI